MGNGVALMWGRQERTECLDDVERWTWADVLTMKPRYLIPPGFRACEARGLGSFGSLHIPPPQPQLHLILLTTAVDCRIPSAHLPFL